MTSVQPHQRESSEANVKVLVAVDFSPHSARALHMAQSIMIKGRRPQRIIALHVIDSQFIKRCIDNQLGDESHVKKTVFLQAKQKLQAFLQSEGIDNETIEALICEGIPFLEINKKAAALDADMIIMGNRGNSGDMQTIFFGSTTERVLRFMSRPVLCVPVEGDLKG